MIHLDDSVVASLSTHLFTDLGGELVILNLVDETYYGLDGVGARVWELIQQPRTIADLVEHISRDYEVDPKRCQHDVQALINTLVKKSLVEVRPAASREHHGA